MRATCPGSRAIGDIRRAGRVGAGSGGSKVGQLIIVNAPSSARALLFTSSTHHARCVVLSRIPFSARAANLKRDQEGSGGAPPRPSRAQRGLTPLAECAGQLPYAMFGLRGAFIDAHYI